MFSWRLLGVAGALVVVALLAGSLLNQKIGALGSDPEAAPPPDPSVATVQRVIDGDTIRVRFLSGAARRVRYIGIDTPELRPEPECFSKDATNFNAQLVAGERVRIIYDDSRKDPYGRLLAYVYRARDGLFVNQELLAAGYATPLTIPPNTRFADRFRAASREARSAKRGLWGACSV